jgi:restriction system protein
MPYYGGDYGAQQQTEVVTDTVKALTSILADGLRRDPALDFDKAKKPPVTVPFDPGKLGVAENAPALEPYVPRPLVGWDRWLPWRQAAFRREYANGLERHRAALVQHAAKERKRQDQLQQTSTAHEQDQLEANRQAHEYNQRIDEFSRDYRDGSQKAICDYCLQVIERSPYPAGFPNTARVAYVAESRQLVIEYSFPPFDVVPAATRFRYVKAQNAIVEVARPLSERKRLYTGVIAQVALRVLRDVFLADEPKYLETVVFNGYVNAVDPTTGHAVRSCLITVRTSRDAFLTLNLGQVDPVACLKALNASVSSSPSELSAVRPVLEFDMVDPRFVKAGDVLGSLDQRPNLMDLTSQEFETLITNLFEKMGLQTRLTQPSRDGGVDCVAYDPRPILGGKVVIQAKRYKNTVGVSAVRDLFGTLQNEGASKGILVTTSGYGKAAFQFAEGKPIELLSGTHLLYLLEQHAGIKAKIAPPEDWQDPVFDTADGEAT